MREIMSLKNIQEFLQSKIIGQANLVESMLVCLVADGHMLIEGMPGLAKTTAAKALADAISVNFKRIQFTPDLLPADITGSDVFLREKDAFEFHEGPLFNNIIIADEINRAPAKVQSALLEAMGERQVTVGLTTRKLPELFLVLATQNPIEQEGTYNLPEAQLDRFLIKTIVGYPSYEEELAILRLVTNPEPINSQIHKTNQLEILEARKQAAKIYMDEKIERYIVSIIACTREPEKFSDDLAKLIRYGASPRATISLVKCAKALALINGSDYVSPHHVQKIAASVLRHRIQPSFEAESENITADDIIERILQVVAVG
jgi:MoxR-like ATPase